MYIKRPDPAIRPAGRAAIVLWTESTTPAIFPAWTRDTHKVLVVFDTSLSMSNFSAREQMVEVKLSHQWRKVVISIKVFSDRSRRGWHSKQCVWYIISYFTQIFPAHARDAQKGSFVEHSGTFEQIFPRPESRILTSYHTPFGIACFVSKILKNKGRSPFLNIQYLKTEKGCRDVRECVSAAGILTLVCEDNNHVTSNFSAREQMVQVVRSPKWKHPNLNQSFLRPKSERVIHTSSHESNS